jgi:Flp pilus assembly protein TadG
MHAPGQRGQSTVEFGASALVLVLLLFGLIDLGRVFYFDVGLQSAVREGARQATWFDSTTGTNPTLYDDAIKSSVDAILTKSGLPQSVLGNPSTTCPSTSDGNPADNPPYDSSVYPAAVNAPTLYICYGNTPGLDITAAPVDNSLKGLDVNVILVMSFGFASGLMSGVLGDSIHIVANTHMTVGGYPTT